MSIDSDQEDTTATTSFPKLDKGKGKLVIPDVSSSTETLNQNLPWVEKYRPSSLDDLISHKDIISTINRFVDENRLPHLLFYGPPGTGKTSTILALAKRLYGPKYKSMILELNASDDRGIDVVREQIKNFASTRKIFEKGFKLIILDEADAMTSVAQAALRRVIEKYTKNVRFCMICNYVGKIIPALQSRCTRFRFAPLEREQIEKRLQFVMDTEGVNITEDGKTALLKLSQGDMRRCLNIVQSCHAASPSLITETTIYSCTGNPLPADIETIVNWMLNEDFTTAYNSIQRMKQEKGYAIHDLITEIVAFVNLLEVPKNVKIYLLEHLADLEYNVAAGATEKLQVAAMVGVFRLATDLAVKASK